MKRAALLITLLLTACSSPVKKVDYAPTPEIPETANPAPVKFTGIELILPPGMDLGTERSGAFCMVPGAPVNRNVLNKAIDTKFIRQTFHDALVADGYDVVGSIDIAFDPEDEEQRAEYAVKGKVKDVQLDMCSSIPGSLYNFNSAPGERGQLYVAIDWSVYDYLKRTVVYKTRTEGYTKRNLPNQEGLSLMFMDAFEMAAHNLAADESFRALLVDNIKPEMPDPFGREEKWDSAPRQFDADEDVTLAPLPLSTQPFNKHADESRKAAVTVQKAGHGSGVFITKQGHILTNAHVVGDARKMRIIPAGPRRGLTAEVLRIDKARDVALLKLTEIPEGFTITTLPVRLDWPKVGEDVYAIGAPQDWKQLRDTITKGIVSAHRKNMKFDGIRQNYLQCDVETHPGNSGGPLVDENGNLVGLDVMGVDQNGVGMGLNYFIPVQEALDRLGIGY
jgi:serine protease Do